MALGLTLFGDNPQQPSIAAEVYVPDQLIAGALHLVTQQVTLAQNVGVTYPRGQVLALNTSTGFYVISTQGGANGVGTPGGVLVDQTNVNAGNVVTDVYVMGEFDSAALTFDSSWTGGIPQLQAAAIATLYFKVVSAGLTQVPEN